jgi:toxin ParE1/3/4
VKPVRLRSLAKRDLAAEVAYYRREGGALVARRLRQAAKGALDRVELDPAIGSPALGRALGIEGMRVWRLDGFPLSFWYFEREDHVDVVRLVGQRQDRSGALIES